MGHARSFDRCIRRRDDPRRACGSVPAVPAESTYRKAAMGKKEACCASSVGIGIIHRARAIAGFGAAGQIQIEEATIEDIQAAILKRELTSTRVG